MATLIGPLSDPRPLPYRPLPGPLSSVFRNWWLIWDVKQTAKHPLSRTGETAPLSGEAFVFRFAATRNFLESSDDCRYVTPSQNRWRH